MIGRPNMGKPNTAPCWTVPKSCKGRRIRSLVTGRWYSSQGRKRFSEREVERWERDYKKLIPSQRKATKASITKEVKKRQGATLSKVFKAYPQLCIDPNYSVGTVDPFIAHEMCEREKTVGVVIDE